MPTESLYTLYPEILPYHATWIERPQGHKIYVELSGNPHGKPIIFLHGGPGGGTNPKQRQFFDPKHYQIILFDQRGCGQSKPLEPSVERPDLTSLVPNAIDPHRREDRWTLNS